MDIVLQLWIPVNLTLIEYSLIHREYSSFFLIDSKCSLQSCFSHLYKIQSGISFCISFYGLVFLIWNIFSFSYSYQHFLRTLSLFKYSFSFLVYLLQIVFFWSKRYQWYCQILRESHLDARGVYLSLISDDSFDQWIKGFVWSLHSMVTAFSLHLGSTLWGVLQDHANMERHFRIMQIWLIVIKISPWI